MHGDDVDVAFDEVTFVGAAYGVSGLVESIEDMAFVVDFGVGGVDVFSGLFFFGEDAATETENTAGDTEDGEHDAATETVVTFAVFEDGEAGFFEDSVGVAVASGMVGEVVPLVKTIAEAEGFDDFVAETSLVEIGESDGGA